MRERAESVNEHGVGAGETETRKKMYLFPVFIVLLNVDTTLNLEITK